MAPSTQRRRACVHGAGRRVSVVIIICARQEVGMVVELPCTGVCVGCRSARCEQRSEASSCSSCSAGISPPAMTLTRHDTLPVTRRRRTRPAVTSEHQRSSRRSAPAASFAAWRGSRGTLAAAEKPQGMAAAPVPSVPPPVRCSRCPETSQW